MYYKNDLVYVFIYNVNIYYSLLYHEMHMYTYLPYYYFIKNNIFI